MNRRRLLHDHLHVERGAKQRPSRLSRAPTSGAQEAFCLGYDVELSRGAEAPPLGLVVDLLSDQ